MTPQLIALIIAGVVTLIAGMSALTAGGTLAKRWLRKEIGLWKRHRRYHPAPSPKTYHLENNRWHN